mmetsp:Transcript_16893/g.29580  ORF Transcript_16893/g.29580 Transcript_16893/m.29580 type:complete len:267 (-) Transcript_16893:148-948(-)
METPGSFLTGIPPASADNDAPSYPLTGSTLTVLCSPAAAAAAAAAAAEQQEARPIQSQAMRETDLPTTMGIESHLQDQSVSDLLYLSQTRLPLVPNADPENRDSEMGTSSSNPNRTNGSADATTRNNPSEPAVAAAVQRLESGHLHTILTFAEMNARDPVPWRYGMLLPFPVDREAWTLIWRNYYIVSISDSATTSALLNQTQRANEMDVYCSRLPGSIVVLTGERTLYSRTYPFSYSATLRHVYIALPVKAKSTESGARNLGIVL